MEMTDILQWMYQYIQTFNISIFDIVDVAIIAVLLYRLLMLVLFTPGLKHLFLVSPAFSAVNLGEMVGLALLPTLVIQIVKIITGLNKGKD